MILKSVFIIAIVAVAMIGVMVPNVFAETSPEQAKPIPVSPLECEYGIPDEYCKQLISQKNTDEELNKLNKLKKLIPDNYNI